MSDERDSIQVDLTDPSSIKEALPRVQAAKTKQADAVKDAQALLDYWGALEAIMLVRLGATKSVFAGVVESSLPGVTSTQQRPPQTEGMTDAVVRVVNDTGEPIRSRDVMAILADQGLSVTADSVSNALHYATTRDDPLIIRVKRGWYAPLRWEGEQESLPTNEHGGEPE